uniref:Uncharacterized protein n=1 Tax=Panagrolaimus sp. ES5 TaxID=591445 RepID=A0AC34FYA2_9BILA
MFLPSASIFLPLICLLLPSCSPKGHSKPVKDSIEKLSESHLTNRRLNLYITANGKHVVIEKGEVKIDDATIEYSISKPPFSIKTRGIILIFTKNPKLYSTDRPSLHQMLAASGHKTILFNVSTFKDSTKIPSIIDALKTKETFSKYSILSDYSVQSQIIEILSKSEKDEIEAAILVGFNESSLQKINNFKAPLLLINDNEIDIASFTNAKSLGLPNVKEFSKDALMHILQNFLDLLHIR